MDSVIKCTDYIIGKHTYLLESKMKDSKLHTIIHDRRGVYEIPKPPLTIINKSCTLFGSSYEATLKLSKKMLGKTQSHKLPIVVGYDYGKPLILYPLFSPKAHKNAWVMFNNVTGFNFQQQQPSITLGHRIDYPLPVQKTTITNQTTTSFALYKNVEAQIKDTHFL